MWLPRLCPSYPMYGQPMAVGPLINVSVLASERAWPRTGSRLRRRSARRELGGCVCVGVSPFPMDHAFIGPLLLMHEEPLQIQCISTADPHRLIAEPLLVFSYTVSHSIRWRIRWAFLLLL